MFGCMGYTFRHTAGCEGRIAGASGRAQARLLARAEASERQACANVHACRGRPGRTGVGVCAVTSIGTRAVTDERERGCKLACADRRTRESGRGSW
ncbi:hypothetical protein CRG98_021387 [Punica granatum]|uniref:Uncharacterized protein n=1 Tax=Punica granatum TaxID=22663 RepID=A0A2I0JRV4_PUNGR|nr:hypothetical protein CRG98_021387 [Punica granatum]